MNIKSSKVQSIAAAISILTWLLLTPPPPQASAQTPTVGVFINEIHYDNDGADTGEAIEIAGPAGTDLTGWRLVLYNGNGGAPYDTVNLSGEIPDQQGSCGTLYFSRAGIQNGAPDGIALIDDIDNVVQFLSYEGSLVAVGGPADGLASTDIGVSESSSTPVGHSLQLQGSGSVYDDFAWTDPGPASFGAVNAGQTFACGGGDTAPTVTSTTPDNDDTNVAVDANIEIDFSEDVVVTGVWFTIDCTTSGVHNAAVSGGPQSYTLDPDTNFATGEACTVTIDKDQVVDADTDDPPDNMTEDYSFGFETIDGPVASNVIINEVDADTPSTDDAEFVELYDGGTGNTDLTGLALVLFNGNGDVSYESFDLDGYTTDADGYFVLCGEVSNVANCDLDVSPSTNLIQNGADAVALYTGDASDFPDGTPVTTLHLLDAIVYDTDDGDDPDLLALLNVGQPQVNEDSGGNSTDHSNQRCPNGSGGARNTNTYVQALPSPGLSNNCEPTAITLASFTTEPGIGSTILTWETGTEVDNAGFNLHRATAPDGLYTKINAALIAAEGDPVAGASYRFVDKGLAAGTYYYKLEDVDLNGITTLHGPVSATVLPGLRKPSYRPTVP